LDFQLEDFQKQPEDEKAVWPEAYWGNLFESQSKAAFRFFHQRDIEAQIRLAVNPYSYKSIHPP